MSNHGCINGRLDDTNYSSPVPVIGLYVAAASFICFLLMLCDIISGYRSRKRWLPCKLFKLDSVILTLLSIAAKIPVDLTTSMPSRSDQFSKLSGTTLICISMCFLMPSLGDNPESETFTNMVAMTIFVIAVVVNICMQLSTGVILLFVAEHIVILCCLLILLMMMWHSYWDISNRKKVSTEENKQIFTKGEGSLLRRLKISFLFGYRTNPQHVACLTTMTTASGVICSLCSAILIQAAFKSLILKQLKFCLGNSDYDWSMPAIVVTQILTVVVGSFAVTFRWLTMFKYMGPAKFFTFNKADEVIHANPVLRNLDTCGSILQNLLLITIVVPIVIIVWVVLFILSLCLDGDQDEWIGRKGNEEMEVWIKQSKSESFSNHLSQLLISRNYLYQNFNSMEVRDPSRPYQKGVHVSSLSIALLVRMAQVSLPENHSRALVQTFGEVNEIFHYIERKINPKNLRNHDKLLFAKAVWAGEDFNVLLPYIFHPSLNPQPQPGLDRSLFIITELKSVLDSDPVWDELGIIVDFINRKTYSTLEDLVTSVEQLFVDTVRLMLAQLPNAIFKSLSDSTDEEYEENVKVALKHICKVESLAQHVQWSFPPSCNFTSLATDDVSSADHSHRLDGSSGDQSDRNRYDQKDVTIAVE